MAEDISNLYKCQEFGEGNRAAFALVAGFDGKIRQLETAGRYLARIGFDSVVYEHRPEALLDGDPEILPRLSRAMSDDFLRRTPDHRERDYGGVSLGGGIAGGMQAADARAGFGIYGATGADLARITLENPYFRFLVKLFHKVDIRRAFGSYSLGELQASWQAMQQPPRTPFSLTIGERDLIVRPREILPKAAAWQRQRPDVRLVRVPHGHSGTIKWLNGNIAALLYSKPRRAA